MTNTGSRWHHAKTVKGFLPPAQENIAFVVAFHFQLNVFTKGLLIAKMVNGHRMVNNQIYRR